MRTTDFLRNLFMVSLFTLRIFAINLLRGNRRRNIFSFIFRFDTNPGFTSNKPTHYLLDNGDFVQLHLVIKVLGLRYYRFSYSDEYREETSMYLSMYRKKIEHIYYCVKAIEYCNQTIYCYVL